VRTAMISGLVLIAAGLYLVFRGVTYTQEQSVVKIGEFEAKVQQQRRVPEWIGGVALGAGVVLVVVGLRRRGR
jgi:drug/metabolite transporter (DMT)-like permease